jgi:serine/threonine protein kinase
MGICDSSNNADKNINQNINPNNNIKPKKILAIENDATGIFARYNIDTDNIDLYRKNHNGYILPVSLARREQIEKYYNIKQKLLGEGAYGQVCIGEKDGVNYAIKRMKKNKLNDLKALLLEAEISLSIKHENIITYYEIFEDLEYISYVMDLGEGGDLFDFIVGCPLGHLPADIVIDLLLQIFDVVDYLHSVKRIIHRDLKPENFMIKINNYNKPLIKLIDFGLATYIPVNGQKIREFYGTREYAAPEIHESSGYLEKVDEWAIGVIMYNMLTGFEPFRGETPSEIKDSVLFSQIRFEEIEDVELRDINKRLLNRYVANRMNSKEALVELKKIKMERDNYRKGQKRINKRTPSIVLKKEFQETEDYMGYWDTITTKIKTGYEFF